MARHDKPRKQARPEARLLRTRARPRRVTPAPDPAAPHQPHHLETHAKKLPLPPWESPPPGGNCGSCLRPTRHPTTARPSPGRSRLPPHPPLAPTTQSAAAAAAGPDTHPARPPGRPHRARAGFPADEAGGERTSRGRAAAWASACRRSSGQQERRPSARRNLGAIRMILRCPPPGLPVHADTFLPTPPWACNIPQPRLTLSLSAMHPRTPTLRSLNPSGADASSFRRLLWFSKDGGRRSPVGTRRAGTGTGRAHTSCESWRIRARRGNRRHPHLLRPRVGPLGSGHGEAFRRLRVDLAGAGTSNPPAGPTQLPTHSSCAPDPPL